MEEVGDAAHERVQMSYPLKRRLLAMRADCPPELLLAADALYARLDSAPPSGFRDGIEALLYLIQTADLIPDGTSKTGLDDDLLFVREACRNNGIALNAKSSAAAAEDSGTLRARLQAAQAAAPASGAPIDPTEIKR
jgi:hypothetical protein